jgi:hypothetical protein
MSKVISIETGKELSEEELIPFDQWIAKQEYKGKVLKAVMLVETTEGWFEFAYDVTDVDIVYMAELLKASIFRV